MSQVEGKPAAQEEKREKMQIRASAEHIAAYTLDAALLARPGNDEIQLDLFLDYASNVALYPKFQANFAPKSRRSLLCGKE